MFFKKMTFSLASLCFLLLLSTQVNAGGVFYSTEGDTIRVPNDTQMIIILKKGTEITALDARGNSIASCETCEKDLENTKMLVTLNKDGNLDVIGGTPPKNAKNKAAATQQDDFIQTVTEGIKLRKIAKKVKARHGLLLTQEGDMVVLDITKGELLNPVDPKKTQAELAQEHAQEMVGLKQPEVSDAEFAEIQRKFDSTITIKATRGSVCMQFAKQPPGHQYKVCSPPAPQWW